MASSSSKLVDNFGEGTSEIKYKECECCHEHTNVKDNLIELKCSCCNKNYQKSFDENLLKRLTNTYKVSNHFINSLFCCCKNILTHINTWMTGKSSMKHE